MNLLYVCEWVLLLNTCPAKSPNIFLLLVGVSQGAQAHNKHRYKWPSRNGYRSVGFSSFCSVVFSTSRQTDSMWHYLWHFIYNSMVCRYTVEYLSFFENIDRDKNKKIYKAFNVLNHFLSWMSRSECFAPNGIPENYFILYVRPKKIISICGTYYNNIFRFKECKSNQRKQGLLIVRLTCKHVYGSEAVEKLTGKNEIMNSREKRHARATTLRGSIRWSVAIVLYHSLRCNSYLCNWREIIFFDDAMPANIDSCTLFALLCRNRTPDTATEFIHLYCHRTHFYDIGNLFAKKKLRKLLMSITFTLEW